MNYFVTMIDYGRRGLEAIVDPEMTRRGTIEFVREKLGDETEIAFVHHIHDGVCEDVTEEIKAEAFKEAFIAAGERLFADQLEYERDHAQDHRKNSSLPPENIRPVGVRVNYADEIEKSGAL